MIVLVALSTNEQLLIIQAGVYVQLPQSQVVYEGFVGLESKLLGK